MSLSTALNIAQNSLFNTQRQMSVVSRNVAEMTNPDYARRSAVLSSLAPGSRIAEVRRAVNEALFRQNLSALSGWTAQSKIVDGLDHLSLQVNGVDNSTSAGTTLGKLQEALQFYSATPSNRTLAENAVEAARDVVRSLNEGTKSIQAYRADMDEQIATAVADLNGLLAEFKDVNSEIIRGTQAGREVLDAFDKRDALLKKISEIVPISTISRDNFDLMIVTADGSTLFETNPRHVTFTPTSAYGAATVGGKIRVDGVPIDAGTGGNTTASGSLAAMLQLRDDVSTGMQHQLDEMARGLNASIPGLLTFTGALADPGIAGRISVNALIDPTLSGNPELLRDGILTNTNPDGNAGYSDNLIGYLEGMDTAQAFTTASGAAANVSLMGYSTEAVSWIGYIRQAAASGADSKSALIMRTTEALSNATSVNQDEETALMLELEHSYSASARLLQTIDNMLATLLDAVR